MKKLLILMILLPLVCFGQTRPHVTQIQPVNTYDELRAIVPSDNGHWAFVAGRESANDGGQGDFFWDSTSTADDDGGAILGAAVAGRWIRARENDGDYLCQWYASLPEAIAAVPSGTSTNAKRLLVTQDHVLSEPLVIDKRYVAIIGAGYFPRLSFPIGVNGVHLGDRDITFENFRITGGGVSDHESYDIAEGTFGTVGLRIEGITWGLRRIEARNLKINNFDTQMLIRGAVYTAQVDNVYMNLNGSNGLILAGGPTGTPSANSFSNIGAGGTGTLGYTMLGILAGAGVTIHGLYLEDGAKPSDAPGRHSSKYLNFWNKASNTRIYGAYVENVRVSCSHGGHLILDGFNPAGNTIMASHNATIDWRGRQSYKTTIDLSRDYYVTNNATATFDIYDEDSGFYESKVEIGGGENSSIRKRVYTQNLRNPFYASVGLEFKKVSGAIGLPELHGAISTATGTAMLLGTRGDRIYDIWPAIPPEWLDNSDWNTIEVFSKTTGVSGNTYGVRSIRVGFGMFSGSEPDPAEYHVRSFWMSAYDIRPNVSLHLADPY